MDKKLQDAFNEQLRNEFYSAYLYLSMAAYCEACNLPGFSHWLQVQRLEELEHGMKFFKHLADRGARIILQGEAVREVPTDFGTPVELFEKVLEHEKFITDKINKLYELAMELKDYPAQVFLQWFITEQVEEEKSASDILAMLKMVKPDSGAIFMIDKKLGER